MTASAAIAAFADSFVTEDDVLLAARDAGDELGVESLSPATCALLTVLARAQAARHVVEVGTGVGVTSLYLLRGMDSAGVLTSIDMEPEHHKAARAAIASAGFGPERTRLITGRAPEVLPRLTDGGYDLVVIDGRRTEFPAFVEEAARLVRVGGMVVLTHALGRGRVPDAAQRDAETTAIREAVRALRLAEGFDATLVPVGDGLVVAVATV